MDDDLSIDLRQYLVVLRQRLPLIAGVALLAALAAWLLAREMPKVYEASVLIATQQPEMHGLATFPDTVFSRAANLDTLVDSLPVRQLAASRLRQSGFPNLSVLDLEDLNTRVRSSGQDLLKFNVQGGNPRLVAQAANALAEALVDNDRNARRANAQVTRRFVERQLAIAKGRLDEAEAALVAFRHETQGATSPSSTLEEGTMQRELRLAEENYIFLSRKLQEAHIAEASIVSSLSLIQPAEIPVDPVRPRPILYLLVGLMLGLMTGTGLAFVLESVDDRLRDSTEVERLTKLPVLAELPRETGRSARDGQQEVGLVLFHEPQSLLAEGYRLLRSVVIFSAARQNISTLMVTSPGPGCGKTTVAANLAIGLALAGKRTVLVEADLRRPQLEGFLPYRPEEPTLLKVLEGNGDHFPLQQTPLSNLRWLPSGGAHPESTELLSADSLTQVLREIRAESDMLVVDVPPVLPVSDALTVGRSTDAVLLVVVPLCTTRGELKETLNRLNHASIPVLGIVLNKVQFHPGQRYYQSYYSTYQVQRKESATAPRGSVNRCVNVDQTATSFRPTSIPSSYSTPR